MFMISPIGDLPVDSNGLRKAVDALERYRRALTPIAEAVENLDENHPDNSEIWESSAAMSITAGDLRRCFNALYGHKQ